MIFQKLHYLQLYEQNILEAYIDQLHVGLYMLPFLFDQITLNSEGQLSGWQLSGGQLSGGQLSGGNCPGGNCPGGNCLGGNCPRTDENIYFSMNKIRTRTHREVQVRRKC